METRVEWTEDRREQSYRMIAELTWSGWEFWEKSAWEVRWYPLTATPDLVTKAELLLEKAVMHFAAA